MDKVKILVVGDARLIRAFLVQRTSPSRKPADDYKERFTAWLKDVLPLTNDCKNSTDVKKVIEQLGLNLIVRCISPEQLDAHMTGAYKLSKRFDEVVFPKGPLKYTQYQLRVKLAKHGEFTKLKITQYFIQPWSDKCNE